MCRLNLFAALSKKHSFVDTQTPRKSWWVCGNVVIYFLVNFHRAHLVYFLMCVTCSLVLLAFDHSFWTIVAPSGFLCFEFEIKFTLIYLDVHSSSKLNNLSDCFGSLWTDSVCCRWWYRIGCYYLHKEKATKQTDANVCCMKQFTEVFLSVSEFNELLYVLFQFYSILFKLLKLVKGKARCGC